jgi:RimJ/RimL family protein N-acetyltransferase
MNADPRVMEHFPGTMTRAESDAHADRIDEHFAEHGFGLWAVEAPGEVEFAGFVGLAVPRFEAHFTPAVEVGWRLAAEWWGRGYATEAAREALRFGFTEAGLSEIVSFTAPANEPSRAVMRRIGMTHDPADDFDHPALPPGHRLRRHVLYRLSREDWAHNRRFDDETLASGTDVSCTPDDETLASGTDVSCTPGPTGSGAGTRRRGEHRLGDLLVAGAAAQVPAQREPHVVLARVGISPQERLRRDQHPRRAEAALDAALVEERGLERMQLAALGKSLDGGDLAAVGLEGEVGARVHRAAVDQHHAGPALGVVAALLGARQPELAPQDGEERPAGVELERVRPVVHLERARVTHRVPPTVIVAGTGTSSPSARRAATSIARLAITSIIALR